MGDVSVAVDEDGSVEGALDASDVDGDTLTYSVTTQPALGGATIDSATGVFTYVPNPDINGTDSFGVEVTDGTLTAGATVSVTVTPAPDAPVAQDAVVSTAEDTQIDGALLASDADGDALSFSPVTGAANGTVDILSDGTFTYTPAADFNGTDSFTFRAFDGGLYSEPATVTINVTPVNDPPVAVDATFEALENTPLNGVLEGYDVDASDTVNFFLATGPTFGTAVVDPATGAFTYTPGPSFIGADAFTFVVSDDSDASATGTVAINVIDPVPNWDFIGFATPWRPNYKVNAGSAVPLKWYYADPNTGVIVPSYHEDLDITATGYPTCNPVGVPIAVLDLPEDAGSSDLRYVDGNWQLNWDTSGLQKGCYYIEIYHPTTNQIDDTSNGGAPLTVQLK